jgi:predicted nucleic acid-binding protein
LLVRTRVEQPSADLADRRAFAHAMRQLPYFERWLAGKPVDATIKTGADKLKARARQLVADAALPAR